MKTVFIRFTTFKFIQLCDKGTEITILHESQCQKSP